MTFGEQTPGLLVAASVCLAGGLVFWRIRIVRVIAGVASKIAFFASPVVLFVALMMMVLTLSTARTHTTVQDVAGVPR